MPLVGGRAQFADGRALNGGASIDLKLQLLDARGASINEVSIQAAPVPVTTTCCGSSSTGWLFVGQVDQHGALLLDQPR